MKRLVLVVALVAACGGGGKKVTVLPVEDEVVDAAAPTVPGAVEVSFDTDDVTITGSYWAPTDPATTGCVVFAHQLSSTRAEYVPDADIDRFFDATVQATEEAVLNSLAANDDMSGRDGNFVPALPKEWLRRTFGGV